MALKQKITFVTDDGREFETELEANGHEKYLTNKRPIEVFLIEAKVGRAHSTYLRRMLPSFLSFMENYKAENYPDPVEPVPETPAEGADATATAAAGETAAATDTAAAATDTTAATDTGVDTGAAATDTTAATDTGVDTGAAAVGGGLPIVEGLPASAVPGATTEDTSAASTETAAADTAPAEVVAQVESRGRRGGRNTPREYATGG